MKRFHLLGVLLLALAGCFAWPLESQARERKITVLQDRDGDGHFNKRTIDVRGRFDRHDFHDHGHSFGYGDRYRYYGRYPYRGYGYGYGYSYGPSFGFSYSPAPSYRSYDYDYDVDDTAVDVQRELRRRGYYRGPLDGDVGPGTRAAIRAYQSERGLPVTGRLDGPLLRSLGV